MSDDHMSAHKINEALRHLQDWQAAFFWIIELDRNLATAELSGFAQARFNLSARQYAQAHPEALRLAQAELTTDQPVDPARVRELNRLPDNLPPGDPMPLPADDTETA